MIRPTCVRVFARTRWWWTAAVSSSDGIGARSASESRSESTTKRLPARIASETSAQISSRRARSAAPPPSTSYRPETRTEPKPGRSPSGVGVDELGELVVVDDRELQRDLAAGRRVGQEQVGLRADAGLQRGDELLADRVQRRVRDLREELREVVEEQPRAAGEHGDGRVGAHRADRLGTGARHRRDEDAQLLLGVAEGLLTTEDRLVRVHDVLALGQVGELDAAGVQPLGVRVLRRELRP